MFTVYEVFADGKRFQVFQHKHRIDCEAWVRNHESRTGWFVIEAF